MQFVGLLILPINAFQFSLTKYFSSMGNKTLHLEGQFFVRILTTIAIIIFILWSLLIPVFQSIFHTNNLSILVLLGVSLALQIIPIPYTSLLQAENRFFSAGMIQIVHSVIRVIAGWVILSQSSTMIGAMLGIIISNIVFLLGSGYPYINSVISNLLSQESISYKIKNFPYKVLWISLGSVGLFSLLVYSDSVLVRSLLPNESALFSSASLFGKGSIFLATAISFIVLPLMSKKTHDSKIALWYGCIFLLVLVIMYCVFFWITAPLIAKILFKNEITIAIRFQKFMPYYTFLFAPYSIIYYFLNYYLVKENIFYPVVLAIGTICLYTGIFLFNNSIFAVSQIVGIVGYSILTIIIIHATIFKNR